MPRAVPVPIRLRLFELADQRCPASAIAQQLALPPRTVRDLLARRPALLAAGLRPAYHRCGRRLQPCDAAIELRRQHPTWGAPYVRVVLAEGPPGPLPSARTLQRHFRRAGLQPAPPGRRPRARRRRARRAHEVWELDACERLRLSAPGQEACWVRLADEHTGAFLRTRVFPPRLLAAGAAGADAGLPARGVRRLGPPRRAARR
jgi:hypothetical protein